MMCEDLETRRLRLRQFTLNDADELYHIYKHRDLFKYMSNEKPLLWEQRKMVIHFLREHWQQHRFGVWAIVHKKEQKLIGHCGFKFLENTREIQLGYLLHPSYWGMGLGTEAASRVLRYGFEKLKFERIVAIAKPENIASRRVMEKVGMKYEKNAYYYNNWVVYYSVEREAYQYGFQGFMRTTKPENLSCLIPFVTT